MKWQFVSIVVLTMAFSSCTKEVVPTRNFSIPELSHGGLILDPDSDHLTILQQLGVPLTLEIEAVTPRTGYNALEYKDNITTYGYSGLVAKFYQSNYRGSFHLDIVEISSDEFLEVYGFHIGMPPEDIVRMFGEENYNNNSNGITSYSYNNYVNSEGVREDCMGYPVITFRFDGEGLESVTWSVVW